MAKIVLAADHGGFELKEKIKTVLLKKRYKVLDAGTCTPDMCDYPQFGFRAARSVSTGEAARGIIICKTGIGMAIIANKLPRVRAGVCNSEEDALSARQHNDVNMLVLAAKKVKEKKAIGIVNVWLKTKALGGRHRRRVEQIAELERKVFK